MIKKIILAISLLMLISCQLVPTTQQQEPIYTENFRTGTEGTRLNFIKNLPPEKLLDTEPFTAMIELTNEGTHTLGGAGDKIYLAGFDPAIIQGISTTGQQIPQLEGRSQYIYEPSVDAVQFKGTIRDLSSLRMDKYKATIVATACYSYETIATAQVCIDPDPYSATAKQKVCTPEDTFLGTQGAPIAVEEVKVIPSKGTTRFRIHVRNAGYGDSYKNGIDYLQKCSPYSTGLAFDEIDYIQVGDVTISGTNIKPTCKPLDSTGHLRLTNGAGVLICELKNIRGQTPYMTPLSILLRYGYRNSIFQEIEILPTR